MSGLQMPDGRSAIARLARPVRVAVALLLLLALGWQGYVTRAHVHQPTIAGAAIAKLSPARTVTGNERPADPSDDCPFCHEIAIGGAYLTPASAKLAPPVPGVAWYRVALRRQTLSPRQSHAWRSRAPPRFLA